VDYRGVDRQAAAIPGTFLDAAAAADALRAHAAKYNLDIPRWCGRHSAGGHLALWLAARSERGLPASRGSPLAEPNPMPIDTVVSLGGLPTWKLRRPPGSGCGTEVIERLVGPPTLSSRSVYADTSIPRLAPWASAGADQRHAGPDHPDRYAEDYARACARPATSEGADDRPTGHVELIAPETEAWAAAVEEIERALRR
jgi:acetyl esterase/lipase